MISQKLHTGVLIFFSQKNHKSVHEKINVHLIGSCVQFFNNLQSKVIQLKGKKSREGIKKLNYFLGNTPIISVGTSPNHYIFKRKDS